MKTENVSQGEAHEAQNLKVSHKVSHKAIHKAYTCVGKNNRAIEGSVQDPPSVQVVEKTTPWQNNPLLLIPREKEVQRNYYSSKSLLQ